jgi:hypothetical protein
MITVWFSLSINARETVDYDSHSSSHSWHRACSHTPSLCKVTVNYITEYQRLHKIIDTFSVFDYQEEKLSDPKGCSPVLHVTF